MTIICFYVTVLLFTLLGNADASFNKAVNPSTVLENMKISVCGTYQTLCSNKTQEYYLMEGKKNKLFNAFEIETRKFADENCEDLRFIIRKRYYISHYDDMEREDSTVLIPVNTRITHIVLKLIEKHLNSSVSCDSGVKWGQEFDISKHSCTASKWEFDYKDLQSEISSELYIRFYFTRNSAVVNKPEDFAFRMGDDDRCKSNWDMWDILLMVIIIGLLLVLIALVVNLLMVYLRKRRLFLPLSTDDGEGHRFVSKDPTADSYIFSNNTFDRIQQQL